MSLSLLLTRSSDFNICIISPVPQDWTSHPLGPRVATETATLELLSTCSDFTWKFGESTLGAERILPNIRAGFFG